MCYIRACDFPLLPPTPRTLSGAEDIDIAITQNLRSAEPFDGAKPPIVLTATVDSNPHPSVAVSSRLIVASRFSHGHIRTPRSTLAVLR